MARRILVIDDEQSILLLVRAVLAEAGWDVLTTSSAVDALERMASIQPDLILLDMRMPVMDGWRFTEELRAQGNTLPIVVMTAARDARVWADEIGAVGYVEKPFEIDDLVGTVARLAGTPDGADTAQDGSARQDGDVLSSLRGWLRPGRPHGAPQSASTYLNFSRSRLA
jgi:CheY-like chemotaxis protein